jgi:hypothetical protein
VERDLLSANGARDFLEHMKASIRKRFREHGGLPPMAALIVTRDDRTGQSIPEGGVQVHFIDGAVANGDGPYGSKDQLSVYLRRAARLTDAAGFLFTSEAWMVISDKEPEDPNASLKDVPGREECIIINFQHRALGPDTVNWSAIITRPKHGKPRLGPWREAGGVSGRFADVLRPDKDLAKEATLLKGLLEAGEFMTPECRRDRIENVRLRLVARGLSEELSRRQIMYLIGIMEERGQKVARLPGDIEPPPRDEGMNLVDLNEEVPIKGADRA